MKLNPYVPFILCLICSCVTGPPVNAGEGPLRVSLSPIDNLRGLIGKTRGRLTLLAGYVLKSKHPHFGGISSLELTSDGRTMIMLTDRGHWISARQHLDSSGRLKRLSGWKISSIKDLKGAPVKGKMNDAEALVRDAQGSWFVSFENYHRIWRYTPSLDGKAHPIPLPGVIKRAPKNGGIEAMSVLPDGKIVVICEKYFNSRGDLRGFILQDKHYSSFSYQPDDDFAATDLAMLPGGDLLVLERSFSLFRGPSAQLRLIKAGQLKPDAMVKPAFLFRFAAPMGIDNFEGLAVQVYGKKKSVLVYIISDDNFSSFQRTLLYQFRFQPQKERHP